MDRSDGARGKESSHSSDDSGVISGGWWLAWIEVNSAEVTTNINVAIIRNFCCRGMAFDDCVVKVF